MPTTPQSAHAALQADWESLRSFAAFIDAGSFSGAARTLGVTHATISRRLQQLEAAMQAPLFIRRADDVELTRFGESVLTAARAMQEQTRQLARTLAGEDLRLEGKLRLACTDAIGTLFLAPRLPALLQQWPALDVELALGHQTLSLARREADLALRFARPQDGELIARRLGAVRFYLCGTPPNVALWRRARKTAPFVGYDDGVPDIPETHWIATHAAGNPVRFRSTSLVAQCMAARAGVGLALLPSYLLAPELQTVDAAPQLERELWAVFHRDLKALPRLRAVLDWLLDCCGEL
ncbi:LysR family transcriptional regulator [Herbaspirillum sp. AP02]|nr:MULTISPECIES: LysR family transcriptional regulator [unclassified Herbaspirillum]MBG7619254.1 LysR family transcriptional regulator [Herbaspirillum sp. AP02]NZD66538.1 LysR family transcriptional regulator [Herbaspirillum sp. AP21]